MNGAELHLWAVLTQATWLALINRWAAISRLRPTFLEQNEMVRRWQMAVRGEK